MKTIHNIAAASVLALSAIAFSATPGAAKAALIASSGHYCLSYNEGGEDCRFASSAQCEATVSGIGAECYGNSFRGDEGFQGRRAGEYQGRIY
jgi:hypothetical protein